MRSGPDQRRDIIQRECTSRQRIERERRERAKDQGASTQRHHRRSGVYERDREDHSSRMLWRNATIPIEASSSSDPLASTRSSTSVIASNPSHETLVDPTDLVPALQDPFPQPMFEGEVCDLFVANNWPFNGADSPWWRRFLQRWIPRSRPVSADTLSGPILDKRFNAVQDRIKPLIAGKIGTGQCDGWKNTARTNIVGTLATVESEVRFKLALACEWTG